MTDAHRSPADAWIGRIVADKYRITRCLGFGGHGAVFEAENTWTERRVALKVLVGAASLNAEMSERFLREARAATRVAHPSIVQVLDMGRDADGSLYIVQELLQGEDLRDVLRRERTVDPYWLIEMLAPVMEGLASAHALGIIHRDLKPANIYLARGHDGRVTPKLIDFGVSRMDEGPESHELTHAGTLLGTPDYMSPEQARGEPAGPQSDVWAMGVVLYEGLSGQRPYKGANYNALLLRILADDAPPLHSVLPGASPTLEAIVHGALTRDVSHRIPSMGALREALLRWAATAPRVATAAQQPPATPVAPPRPDASDITPLSVDLPAHTVMEPLAQVAPVEALPGVSSNAQAELATPPPHADSEATAAPEIPALSQASPTPEPVEMPAATPRAWTSTAHVARRSQASAGLVAAAVLGCAMLAVGGFLVATRYYTASTPTPGSVPVAARGLPAPDAAVSTTAPDARRTQEADWLDARADVNAVDDANVATTPDDVEAAPDADAEADVRPSDTAHNSSDRRALPPPTLERPDPTEFRRLFPTATQAVRACVRGQEATILVAVTIRGTGQVQEVQVPPPWVNTPVGGCIAAAVRRLRFQRFRQERFTVTWPYVIRPAAPVTED